MSNSSYEYIKLYLFVFTMNLCSLYSGQQTTKKPPLPSWKRRFFYLVTVGRSIFISPHGSPETCSNASASFCR